MAQLCAPGFDCALLNSCPSYYVACPSGYFCSSYQGFPDQTGMDYQYAVMKEAHAGVEVTHSNAHLFIDPNRAIQNRCLNGFFCSSSEDMASCPSGHWCSESTVEPRPCGIASICPENSYYEINFTNLIIGGLAAVCILFLSSRAVRQQQIKEAQCRNIQLLHRIDPSEDDTKKRDSAGSCIRLSGQDDAIDQNDCKSIAIELEDVVYHLPGSRSPILNRISASLPAGKMTLILGPSGCGKTSLLNVIRTGGKDLSKGSIRYHLQNVNNSSSNPNFPDANRQLGENVTENSDILSPLLENPSLYEKAYNNNHTTGRSTSSDEQQLSVYGNKSISDIIGLVPQDDILDRKLTVREHLLFYALTRSKTPLSLEQAQRIVQKTLQDLAIAHIADAIIGGGENAAANISGGQLKRVNIACELVAISVPGVLLLDEPTSGLDAAVAFDLMECINQLKDQVGVTIVCVLQQPRHEIFAKMDHVLLMHPKGHLVFAGRSDQASDYLQQELKYQPYSMETSDADFCIDVLNAMKLETDIQSKSITNTKNKRNSRNIGGQMYHSTHQQDDLDADFTEDESIDENEPRESSLLKSFRYTQYYPSCASCQWLIHAWDRAITGITHERFHRQVYLQIHRLILVRLRDRTQLLIAMAINVIMAVSLSSGFSVLFVDSYSSVFAPPVRDTLRPFYPAPLSPYSEFNTNDFPLQQLLFFTGAALGCGSCLAAIPVFSGMKSVAQREHVSGVSLSAYALGRMIGDLPFVLTMAFVFCGTWCSFGMPGYPGDWLLVIGATAYAASGIGYVASTFSSAKNASVNAIILTFLCAVFSGVEPTLRQVEKYPILSYPWYVSFGTWTSEATYVTWAQYLHDFGKVNEPIQEGASVYGYDVSHGLTRSIFALIALGTVIRLFVLILIQLY